MKTEQPIDPANGRFLCTKEMPMPKDSTPGRWAHEDVREVGDQENGWPGGDIVTYECKSCGVTWRAELPQ